MRFALYKNEIFFIILIFFSFSQKISIEIMEAYFKISYFILPIFLVFLLYSSFKNNGPKVRINRYEILYILLILYLALNTIFLATDILSKFKYLMLMVFSGVFYLVLKKFYMVNGISLSSFLNAYRTTNLIFIAFSIIYYMLGVFNPISYGSTYGAFYGEGLVRLEGLANNPIFFGLFITPYYFLLLFDVIKGDRKSIAPLILTIIALLLTISKAPIGINFGLTLIYLIFYYMKENKHTKKKKIFKYAISIIGISFVSFIIPPINKIVKNRVEDLVSSGGSGRLTIWSNAYTEYIDGNLLFGRGFFKLVDFNGVMIAIHNTFLEFLFNTGIVGFSFYVLIIISFIISLNKIELSYMKSMLFLTLISLLIQINFVTAPYHEVLFIPPLILTLLNLGEKEKREKYSY
jgi:O-antigen ligase